jgi:hypothetical protein
MKDLGRAVLPTGADLAMSVLPNVIFSGMTAASLPEGTDLTTRLGAGAEDLLGGLAAQTLGRGMGYSVGRGVGRVLNKPLPEEWRHIVTGAGEIATEAGAYPFMPRPFANKAYEDYNQRMAVDQEEAQLQHDEEVRQRALLDAHAFGYQTLPSFQQAFLPGAGGHG